MNTVASHTAGSVDQAIPTQVQTGQTRLPVKGTSTTIEKRSYIHFAPPFPTGAKITSATLRLTHAAAAAGSHTLRVKRIVTAWQDDKNTWNTKPTTTTVNQTDHVISAPAAGAATEIDVTALFGDVGDGGPYYGLELSLPSDNDAADPLAFYSPDGPDVASMPELDIEWRTPPYAPVALSPGSGNAVSINEPKLSWQFTAAGADAVQASSQVQIASDALFASVVYDSTKIANTDQSHDLDGLYALPSSTDLYWRVKVWDDSNIESGWSDSAKVRYGPPGSLTILNPAASPNNYVDETTPPITWTFTGQVQDRVALTLYEYGPEPRPGYLRAAYEIWHLAETVKHDTIATNTYAYTLPSGLLKSGKDYRIEIKVWDTTGRESIAGAAAYLQKARDFYYKRDGTPDSPTHLTVTPYPPATADKPAGPGLLIAWKRATEPDFFSIRIDGAEDFDRLAPIDLIQPDGSYEFVWWRGRHGHPYTIEVEAVVSLGGTFKHSDGPTVTVTPDVKGKWLVDEDLDEALLIADVEQVSLALGESATTYALPGSRKQIRITESIRGYEGSVSGTLVGVQDKALFEDMKGSLGVLRFIERKLNIPVRLGDTSNLSPRSSTGRKDWWLMSTDLFQVGEFTVNIEG